VSVAGLGACATSDNLPEITYDGLHRAQSSNVRVAYVRPGASLDQYRRIKLLDCYVAFQKNWQRQYNAEARGAGSKVTAADMDRIRQNVADEFRRVFTAVLEKEGSYEIVDETGEDVLLLRPAIIDLYVSGPDLQQPGINYTVVSSAGRMTLYLELYDSASNEIIARVVDPRSARGAGRNQLANRVTNKAEADRILRRWALLLRDHLDAATGKS
jgi:hypothetical protein